MGRSPATPPWTKATSIPDLGSLIFFRLSSDPSEVTILSLMPLRAKIFLYFSAVFQKLLCSGPVAIVMVFGGAGWMNQIASQMATIASKTIGPKLIARSRHEIETNRIVIFFADFFRSDG